jgi:UDP-glucose 4-epimerase
MRVLVTGGAGYIGSITCQSLKKQGFTVVVYDSLEHGYKKAVEGLELIEGKIQDEEKLSQVLKNKKIEAVIHFAAYIEMGESMEKPAKYFKNNVFGSLQLFKATLEAGVKKLVFSSSAGVYGNPERLPIKEDDRKLPENPYGESKLMVETMLEWFDQIYQLRSISLRYFVW